MGDDAIPFMFSTREEYEKWKLELHAANAQLRELADKAGRAKVAEEAGEAFDVAEAFGAQVPGVVRTALGAAAFFLPTLKLLPFGNTAEGKAARHALDIVIESIELACRVFDIKGR